MDTKDMILELRTKMGLSQDELAEKVFVTRQAVSRWDMANFTATIAYEWFENGKLLGSAKYHAANGLNFSKYINTEEKVNELLNRMLPGTPALPTRYSE